MAPALRLCACVFAVARISLLPNTFLPSAALGKSMDAYHRNAISNAFCTRALHMHSAIV